MTSHSQEVVFPNRFKSARAVHASKHRPAFPLGEI